jgi:hypothetical protein
MDAIERIHCDFIAAFWRERSYLLSQAECSLESYLGFQRVNTIVAVRISG